MSAEAVREVIDRAIADGAFRHQLFSNPGAALQDYDLSQPEIDMLSNLDEDRFDVFVSRLDDRATKGSIPKP